MDKTNKEELTRFTNAITAMAAGYRQELDQPGFEAYLMAMEDLPIEGVEYAVRRAIKDCKFMPNPAELLELTGAVGMTERAVLAFDVFSRALRGNDSKPGLGPYKSADFDDRAINATVRLLGGWEAAYYTPDKEFTSTYRRRFEETYKVFARNGVSRENGMYLPGITEKENRLEGFAPPAPFLIPTGLPYLDRVMKPLPEQKNQPPATIAGSDGPRKLSFDHHARRA